MRRVRRRVGHGTWAVAFRASTHNATHHDDLSNSLAADAGGVIVEQYRQVERRNP
jgi:hypothetical protein